MLTALLLVTAGCTDDAGPEPAAEPTTPSASSPQGPPSRLTFGVFGPRDEIDAFASVVEAYNSTSDDSTVTLRTWSSHDALLGDLKDGVKVPDVFLASRSDLAWLREQKITQPVDDLLDERGVNFGDDYSRDALEAYSVDNRLQCMPYGISPMVIYYNEKLVDFDKMLRRGVDVPNVAAGTVRWNFDQFANAAAFATRPAKRSRGVYVDPTLRGLAPFIYSGGGSLFDDEANPTSLALSDSDSRSALARTLLLLRDPQLTLTEKQLEQATPLEWFKRGRLGMVEGFRSLVPELRRVRGLDFDVMPMPVLDSYATVGDITGLCLSARAASTPEAADFLVHATSTTSVTRVARAGSLAPANLEVALSDDFLQKGRQPDHAEVFNTAVRTMVIPPLLDSGPALEAAVAPDLRDLLTVPVLDDLEVITQRIDDRSREVLDPEAASESPQ
jgi:multiple sugar transport system substrate-binding protein